MELWGSRMKPKSTCMQLANRGRGWMERMEVEQDAAKSDGSRAT